MPEGSQPAEEELRRRGFKYIIGIDEAGRGPLAGPVVASAVMLNPDHKLVAVKDSKKLSPKQREVQFQEIYQHARVGIGVVSETVIDEINILEAAYLAMNIAVKDLFSQNAGQNTSVDPARQTFLLIDGNSFKTELPYPYRTVIKGDSSVMSIACASIIAKVTRDRILDRYDRLYPEYGFARHKGYGTRAHRDAIVLHGPSKVHRKTFAPVKRMLNI